MKILNPIFLTLLLAIMNCTPKMQSGQADVEINGKVENEHLLEDLLNSQPEYFGDIVQNKDKYQVQVIYTQINRDSTNEPHFTSFYYNVDPDRYFYPASTVKMPAAFVALEKLNGMNIDELDKNTIMLTDSAFSGQTVVVRDSTSASGFPSIAHYLKKIFLVSDNDAFNRIYEFVGQKELNQQLHKKGYTGSRIIGRLSVFLNEEENRHTNPVRFVYNDSVIYQQPMLYNRSPLPSKGQVLLGKGYMKNGVLVPKPMNFTLKNFIPLEEMQLMLRAVLFPESIAPERRFNLTDDDYRFLYRYMSQLPSETTFPTYDPAEFHDGYSKLLMFGNEKRDIPKHIRVFNKYGQAYGFLIDNAYIVDFKNKVEFMLSAVIHTNEDQVYNDGKYEYDEVAFPFMKNLGKAVYNYELKRKRAYMPDLTKFMIGYDKVVKIADDLHTNLFANYNHYHVPSLDHRKIKRSDIAPLIERLKRAPRFEVSKVGESVEGRDINLIRLGSGPTEVLLWSQMHGDESTATRAIFEIFNFFATDDALNSFKERILEETTLYFIPMLNPDGAEKFERRNALSIDINRDALRLTSPEGKILKTVRDKYDPEFGFNLHDQSKHYNVYRTGKTASISFLSPAYNYEKDVNDSRVEAMKLIVSMNKVLQRYIPGQVGRYDDSFEPRAFGDNIQKWGTNTILIESGGQEGDPEKKELVKMNFIAILHALDQIATRGYRNEQVRDYLRLPANDNKFFDLLIRNGHLMKNGKTYKMDIGIVNYEGSGASHPLKSRISDMGDLSTYYGYHELDAEGLVIGPGKVYPELIDSAATINEEMIHNCLKAGVTGVRVKNMAAAGKMKDLPLVLMPAHQANLPDVDLGEEANLILRKDGEVKYAVIKGRIIEVKSLQLEN